MIRRLLLASLVLITFFAEAQNSNFSKRLPIVEKYFDSLLKEWNIPGLAIGIVYKDQLIYSKGFGYRDLEKKLPVEPTTLFPIASNTKLFTATAACMLAEENKFSLDKPVKNYLPAINFYTEELNAKVTLRDMLSHRTGLPRYDAFWANASFSRKELVEKISYMKPQLGFREGYIYNNVMFAAAGAVMEAVTHSTWEDIIRQKIFAPLQMNASCFNSSDMKNYGNYSLSYFEQDSTKKLLPRQFEAQSMALGPAGTIKSSVEDMSRWMIAQLNNGKYKGVQVIPATVINQTLIPNTIADKENRWNELSNSLYCMGRTIQTYKGYRTSSHTGSIDGFYSNLTFLPDQQLGIFIVFNAVKAGSLRSVISLPVIDRLLDLPNTPWSQRYMMGYMFEVAQEKKANDSIKLLRVPNTTPSHPIGDYTGVYSHPIYGDVKIDLENGQLFINFRSQRSLLYHYHYDQFATDESKTDKPNFRLSFLTNSRGAIQRISMMPYFDPFTEFIKK
jgi:CubicO group peptidase (beta-lactamase class C family)